MLDRTIVAGGRDFDGYNRMCLVLDRWNPGLVLCGVARGADALGRRWAKDRDVLVELYPANWDRYGKAAGLRRNCEMAQKADSLVAFWDGKSRGTHHMIREATRVGLNILVFRY